MQKIHFSIHISAPKDIVWNTMLEKETYSEWTKAFDPTSTYEGSWEEGQEIRFVSSDKDKGQSGMYSKIYENRPYEYISIEHIGMIENGVVDTTSEKVKEWTPAFENYTFKEVDNGTEVSVDIDVNDEYKGMFEEMWPKALQSLKELAENKIDKK